MSVTAFFEYLLAHESTEGLGADLCDAYVTRARTAQSVATRNGSTR